MFRATLSEYLISAAINNKVKEETITFITTFASAALRVVELIFPLFVAVALGSSPRFNTDE